MHDRLLATPVIVHPNMCDQEMDYEWQRMCRRSLAINGLLSGKIDLETFEDIFNENGVNPHQFEADKNDGLYYM